MADVEVVLYDRMQATAALLTLVSTRCYPIKKPADADLPHLVFKHVSETDVTAMGSNPGNVTRRYRFWIYGATPAAARAVAAELKTGLNRYRASGTTPVIEDIFHAGSFEDYVDGGDLFEIQVDYLVHYRE